MLLEVCICWAHHNIVHISVCSLITRLNFSIYEFENIWSYMMLHEVIPGNLLQLRWCNHHISRPHLWHQIIYAFNDGHSATVIRNDGKGCIRIILANTWQWPSCDGNLIGWSTRMLNWLGMRTQIEDIIARKSGNGQVHSESRLFTCDFGWQPRSHWLARWECIPVAIKTAPSKTLGRVLCSFEYEKQSSSASERERTHLRSMMSII